MSWPWQIDLSRVVKLSSSLLRKNNKHVSQVQNTIYNDYFFNMLSIQGWKTQKQNNEKKFA